MLTSLSFSNLVLSMYKVVQRTTQDSRLSYLTASRKMTLLPAARVRISPSLVISMPPIWSEVVKLLISDPVAVSHTRTVLSSLQLTSALLSGVYIT